MTSVTERWVAKDGLRLRRGRFPRGVTSVPIIENTLAGLPSGPLSAASLRTIFANPLMNDNSEMRGRFSITNVGGDYGNALTVTLPDSSAGVVFQPSLPEAFEKGYLEYDFRWRSGFPFGGGGKLPGLGGFRPPLSSPPSGGNASPYGWAARNMWLRDAYGGSNGYGTELIGYPYLPWQSPGSYGMNRLTKYSVGPELGVSDGTWRKVRIVTHMNSVTTEGSTSPPANGLHQILVNGVPIYTKTDEIWRFYSDIKISHWAFAVFYGGGDDWSGGGGLIDIANLRVVKEL